MGLGVALLIAVSVALPVVGLVQLKMLPFDNKSEFQVVVDMPAGTPLEKTAAVLNELGGYLATVPEVILARFLGLKVAAISTITNMAAGLSDEKISHEHTKAMAPLGAAKLERVLRHFLRHLR